MVQELLFNKNGHLRDYLEQRNILIKYEVEKLESNYILNVSEDDLCQSLISQYSLEFPVLHDNDIYVYDQRETEIDVSQDMRRFFPDTRIPSYAKGISIIISVPFSGDSNLFQYQPSTFTLNPPRGQIEGQEIRLIYERVKHDTDELKQAYTRDVKEIRDYLNWIRLDIENFNRSLESFIKQIIIQRKKKLLDAQGVVGALGIPIRKNNDMPRTYAVPDVRRRPKIERPKANTETFKPEPILPLEEYENILKIIQNMVLVIERSPRAFADMKEEDLRQHFLVQLNGHYEGEATGETFNYEGKTDLLIRSEGKNVFIAECKFWTGEKDFIKAIYQLLKYVSWRDTKTALLLFNRQKDFSSVLEKIPKVVKSHLCYKRDFEIKGETMFRYIFHQPEDVNREFILTVMVFNVPK
jgi:hypothetical protein